MDKLISIIVPVYNVEQYLKQCVDSILNQTYKQLEVILVDDGSTDSSRDICNQYEAADNRIKVIHKENGGLADARNAGLSIATGEYIGFVDSDDFIHKDMYKTLVILMEQNNADMVMAKWQAFVEQVDCRANDTLEAMVFDGIDSLKFLIYGENRYHITLSVWDRLYKKELIKDLMFPKGKCYEDVVWSTEAFYRAKRTVYIDKTLYYYRQRANSITGVDKDKALSKRILTDQIPQMEAQIEYLESIQQFSMADEVRFYLYEMLILLYCKTRHTKVNDMSLELYNIIKKYKRWAKVYIMKRIGGYRKVIIFLSLYFFDILVMVIQLKRKNL